MAGPITTVPYLRPPRKEGRIRAGQKGQIRYVIPVKMKFNQLHTIICSGDIESKHIFKFWSLFRQNWYFRKFEGYILYETRIGKLIFQLKLGVNQLHTIICSEDMEFEHFPKFWPLFRQNWDFRFS